MTAYHVCEDCGDPHHGRPRWCPRCLPLHSAKCKECSTKYDKEDGYNICKSCRSQIPLIETPADENTGD